MRICEANTRILRANFRLKTDAMSIKLRLPMQRFNASPKPRRIELYAGCGRKENALATQAGTRIPNGSPGGRRVPESALRLGYSFRMMPQAETTSRNLRSEWDSFSGWRAQRKLRPGICSETGTRFPADRPALSTPKSSALSSVKLGRRKPKRNGRRSP